MSTKSTVTAQVLSPPAPSGSAVGSRPRQPQPLSESQFSSLLSAMQESERRLDRKLAEFKSDVRQDKTATKVINRVRREKPYEFKRKAHEEQARFNVQVEESVQEAQDALSLTSTTLRPSSAPTRHWTKVRAFWPKGRNLLRLPTVPPMVGG